MGNNIRMDRKRFEDVDWIFLPQDVVTRFREYDNEETRSVREKLCSVESYAHN
jgi:hypothetical protein